MNTNTILAIAVVLVLLWAVGFFALPGIGTLVHILLVTSRDLDSCLACDWQKVVEIKSTLSFFVA